jgi:TolB protein
MQERKMFVRNIHAFLFPIIMIMILGCSLFLPESTTHTYLPSSTNEMYYASATSSIPLVTTITLLPSHTQTTASLPMGGGGKIVYSTQVGSIGGTTVDTYIYDVEKKRETPIILEHKLYKQSYSWSPDGMRIIFMAGFLNPISQIDIVDINTGSIDVVVSSDIYRSFDPSWSPDGKKIAFSSDKLLPGEGMYIYIMNVDGTDATRIVNVESITPSWSPDGKKIAFADSASINGGIWIMNVEDNRKWKICDFGVLPNWSPDGTKITFEGDSFLPELGSGMFIVNKDGGNLENLYRYGGSPSWSPDGKMIAFHSNYPNGEKGIYVIDIQSKKIIKLPTQKNPAHPMWSR